PYRDARERSGELLRHRLRGTPSQLFEWGLDGECIDEAKGVRGGVASGAASGGGEAAGMVALARRVVLGERRRRAQTAPARIESPL
ncbi:hypothetical protein LTR53_018482, partial [Teratosphaeriaceae sp. CCFEE 6253]